MRRSRQIGYSRVVRPTQLIVLVALVAVFSACKERGHALADHVRTTCETLAGDLDHGAKKHAEFATWARGHTADDVATWARGATPDQTRQDADFKLPCHWPTESRMVCGVQLGTQLKSCINARQGKTEDLNSRVWIAIDRFGSSKDPDAVTEALRELASIAAEANSLPFKD